jgi:hypothetical protein
MFSLGDLCGRALRHRLIDVRGLKFCLGREQGASPGIGLRRGWRVLSLVGTALLAGCSLSPYVMQSSLDYNEMIEELTNSGLVTNILRARDGAPLYFSDVPLIRGAVSVSGQSQATWPFGPVQNSTSRNSATAGPLTVTTNPGWDFAPLNTKNFAQGILGGINVNVFAYFQQRPINSKVLFSLVINRVEEYGAKGEIRKTYRQHHGLEKLINDWTAEQFTPNGRAPTIDIQKESTPVGPPIPAWLLIQEKNTLADIAQLNTAGLDLKASAATASAKECPKLPKSETSAFYRVCKPTTKYVLCVPHTASGYEAVGIESPSANKAPTEPPLPKSNDICGKETGGAHKSPPRYVVVLRSVEEIFYYLGELIKNPGPNDMKFYIYQVPPRNVRFRVYYRGEPYFVSEATRGEDATISILAVLNDLLNLNRDANDIPSTKTVATTGSP